MLCSQCSQEILNYDPDWGTYPNLCVRCGNSREKGDLIVKLQDELNSVKWLAAQEEDYDLKQRIWQLDQMVSEADNHTHELYAKLAAAEAQIKKLDELPMGSEITFYRSRSIGSMENQERCEIRLPRGFVYSEPGLTRHAALNAAVEEGQKEGEIDG